MRLGEPIGERGEVEAREAAGDVSVCLLNEDVGALNTVAAPGVGGVLRVAEDSAILRRHGVQVVGEGGCRQRGKGAVGQRERVRVGVEVRHVLRQELLVGGLLAKDVGVGLVAEPVHPAAVDGS